MKAGLGLVALILAAMCSVAFWLAGFEVPRATRIGECKEGTNLFRIRIPTGNAYQLVMADSSQQISVVKWPMKPAARLTLVVRDTSGKIRFNRDVTLQSIKSCNWLTKYGYPDAYILTLPSHEADIVLEHSVESGKEYSLTVVLGEDLTNRLSLWICWLGRPRLTP